MRNLEASGWITKPELSIIQARGGDKSLPYEFALSVTLMNPSEKTDPEADSAPAAGGGK